MGEAVLDNIEMYSKYGCMDKFMDSACFSTHATEEEKEEVNENNSIIDNYSADISVYGNMPDQFLNAIVEINILFNRYEREQK